MTRVVTLIEWTMSGEPIPCHQPVLPPGLWKPFSPKRQVLYGGLAKADPN